MNTYTTRDEAIEYLIMDLLDGSADEFDVEAIADEVIVSVGEGVNHCYKIADEYTEADKLWKVALNYEL
nr:MAG TPA: hypothetical protein [Caudoviricetes sp.]